MSELKVKAFVPVHGTNRMNAERVGEKLKGCNWVGIPFAGGMCEVPYIAARTIAVNDLHRGIISLARIVNQNVGLLQDSLRKQMFHPDELIAAQRRLFPKENEVPWDGEYQNALDYFTVAWMTRSGSAGTNAERTGKLCLRWEAGGGDNVKRYHSAVDSLPAWAEHFKRCQFTTLDCFEFLDKCKDREGHGIYCDPPFFGKAGEKYTHNCGTTTEEQEKWHLLLAMRLEQFQKARVVVRAYDDPWVRSVYRDGWTWHEYESRKQTNATANEVLIVRNR